MFSYDPTLLAVARTRLNSVADVLQAMQTIQAACVDGDGLKWFNWLYLQVTQAAETRIAAGGFTDPAWLAELDVQFARLYFDALELALMGQLYADRSGPGCWDVLFESRDCAAISRIQFAMAGINAHINHDLPEAIVNTCKIAGNIPQHACKQYNDYTALNSTLDSLIDSAKQTLHVRLLGDALPPVSHLENTIAAWNVGAAREAAWSNAEILWHLRPAPPLSANFMDTLDGLTTVAGKALLVPVP